MVKKRSKRPGKNSSLRPPPMDAANERLASSTAADAKAKASADDVESGNDHHDDVARLAAASWRPPAVSNVPAEEPRRSKAGAKHEEVLHDSFFEDGEHHPQHKPQEPVEDADDDHVVSHYNSMSPVVIERRRKLRRMVAYILAPVVMIALVGGARLLQRNGAAAASSAPAVVEPPTAVVEPPVPAPQPVPAAPATTVVAAESVGSTQPVASAEPPQEEPTEPPAPAAMPEPAASAPSEEPKLSPADSKKELARLLNMGKFKDAVLVGPDAVAGNPEDALVYLYLGTALQELGRGREAVEVYSKCVHTAKRGPVHECRAVGGR